MNTAVGAKVNQLKVAATQREAELQRLRQQLHRRFCCNASSCTTSSGGSLPSYRTGTIPFLIGMTQREAELQRLRQQLHRRFCNASSCTTSSGGCLSGYRTESLDGLKTHTEELTASKSRIQKKYEELNTAVDAKVNQLKVAVTQREAELQLHRRSCNASSCTTSSGGCLSS
ncbi:uncharacterized protein [Palaemon carinicauda]|uniref:uncharacterized protein isoform X3 n=1 Tax=Palaemon carinicauda TaxID=392227 RepID=UPI0035B58CD4